MELITSAFAAVGAFIGTIAAHFIAHDAYSRCPRYARRLVKWAARQLPPFERERYEEEWLADLEERDGAFAKFKHAFECFLCAHKLSTLAKGRTPASIEFVVTGHGRASASFVTGIILFKALMLMSMNKHELAEVEFSVDSLEALERGLEEQYGDIDPPSADQVQPVLALFDKLLDEVRNGNPAAEIELKLKLRNGREGNIRDIAPALDLACGQIFRDWLAKGPKQQRKSDPDLTS
jgi:hypothetical protein